MEALNKLIERIGGADKVCHNFGGGWFESKFVETGNWQIMLFGWFLVLAFSIVKEYLFDKESKPDWKDILAGQIGATAELLYGLLIT